MDESQFNKVSRIVRKIQVRKEKSLEEEVFELTEHFATKFPSLDFQSYQAEVMKITKEWPIQDPDKVLQQIVWHAQSATGGNKQIILIQAACILRRIAELCDYLPTSMERAAQISLSELPTMSNELGTNPSEIKKIE